MCGICLSENSNKRILVDNLISNHFQSVEGLEVINETSIGHNLITNSSYDIIKRSIESHDYERIHMLNDENYSKLFELALITSKMWDGRFSLNVHILPHAFDNQLDSIIENVANEWQPFSGITFVMVPNLPADIIIQINANGVHSSQIGKDAIPLAAKGTPTMQLGIGIERDQQRIRRPILHEFGHALGCIHEHNSPASTIQWNEPAVIRMYALAGWDEQKVRHNVFHQYSASTISNSTFDPHSIMIYPIDSSQTTNGYSVPWNTELSDQDKAFMRLAYSRI